TASFCHDDWVLLALEYINTRADGTFKQHNWLASLPLLYGNVMNSVFSAYGDMPSHNAPVGELIVGLKVLDSNKDLHQRQRDGQKLGSAKMISAWLELGIG
ncbi:hypothetical protein GO594_31925, partial [Pseudomonas otitidis]|nr:hypothetical protein [Pseudomonas otitidis]